FAPGQRPAARAISARTWQRRTRVRPSVKCRVCPGDDRQCQQSRCVASRTGHRRTDVDARWAHVAPSHPPTCNERNGSDEGLIMAEMFTKSQTGYLDEYWGLDSSGNC